MCDGHGHRKLCYDKVVDTEHIQLNLKHNPMRVVSHLVLIFILLLRFKTLLGHPLQSKHGWLRLWCTGGGI